MEMYEGVNVYIHISTRRRLVVRFNPGRFTPEERLPGTHPIGGWMGLRSALDYVK
jgi:hypothetical protein